MSQAFDLIISQGNRLILNKDVLSYLSQIKEEVVLVTILSSTDDNNLMNNIKLSLLSSMTNSKISDSNTIGATFYTSKLKKENSGASVLFANMKSSNKHLLSLLFLSSSLFIFCVNEGINDKEISKFLNINNLSSTIELQQKSNRELIFTESSPKCIFFISNSNKNMLNTFPKDYLDTELRKKSNNAQINLARENLIKFFPDRDCILDSQQQYNILLVNKIIKEMNPKTIKGKLFDGNSLAFFIQNFCDAVNNMGNPNFDLLFNNLINNDLKIYQQKALNYYSNEVGKMTNVENDDNLIAKIYQSKINAIEKFNEVYNLNIDTFNNPEYKTWYTRAKTELEKKFMELENQKLQENANKSMQLCQQLLTKHYAVINQKISSNLIDFLEVNKPNYFKNLVSSIEKENQNKIMNANKMLEDSKKRKNQQEEQYRQLNEQTEEKNKRVEDICSQIERKKREIKSLNTEIERMEEEIKKAQTQDDTGNQKNQF